MFMMMVGSFCAGAPSTPRPEGRDAEGDPALRTQPPASRAGPAPPQRERAEGVNREHAHERDGEAGEPEGTAKGADHRDPRGERREAKSTTGAFVPPGASTSRCSASVATAKAFASPPRARPATRRASSAMRPSRPPSATSGAKVRGSVSAESAAPKLEPILEPSRARSLGFSAGVCGVHASSGAETLRIPAPWSIRVLQSEPEQKPPRRNPRGLRCLCPTRVVRHDARDTPR
jgi:hypothetical protein